MIASAAADAARSASMTETRIETSFADTSVGDRVVVVNTETGDESSFAVTRADGGDDSRWFGGADGYTFHTGQPVRIYRRTESEPIDESVAVFNQLLGTYNMDTDGFYDAANDILAFVARARAAGIK